MLSRQVQKVEIIAEDGKTYSLSGKWPAHFLYLDGAGLPPIKRVRQALPAQHGTDDRGFRLEPRRMTLGLYVEAPGADEVLVAKAYDQLAYLFGPTDTALKLRVTRLDGAVRQIDCYLDGAIDFSQSERMGGSSKVLVPLYAPDPTFYDPTQRTQTASLNAASTVVNLSVAGTTWEDWPIVDITGPANTLVMSLYYSTVAINVTTAIPSGETFRFDFRPGHKGIKRTSDNANRITYISPFSLSGLDHFRIYSEKDLSNWKVLYGYSPTSIMDVTFQESGYNANTQVTFYWYNRYIAL